jgi:hypothetical protein
MGEQKARSRLLGVSWGRSLIDVSYLWVQLLSPSFPITKLQVCAAMKLDASQCSDMQAAHDTDNCDGCVGRGSMLARQPPLLDVQKQQDTR